MAYISNHASRRMQKRSVPPIVLDWLHDYGSEQYDGRGAVIRYFDRAAKERLKRVSAIHSGEQEISGRLHGRGCRRAVSNHGWLSQSPDSSPVILILIVNSFDRYAVHSVSGLDAAASPSKEMELKRCG
jgi:hypothetical protein